MEMIFENLPKYMVPRRLNRIDAYGLIFDGFRQTIVNTGVEVLNRLKSPEEPAELN